MKSVVVAETKTEISLIVQFDGRRVDLSPVSRLDFFQDKILPFWRKTTSGKFFIVLSKVGFGRYLRRGNTKAESYSGIERERALTSARLTLKA